MTSAFSPPPLPLLPSSPSFPPSPPILGQKMINICIVSPLGELEREKCILRHQEDPILNRGCIINNLNICIKTEPATAGVDARCMSDKLILLSLYIWLSIATQKIQVNTIIWNFSTGSIYSVSIRKTNVVSFHLFFGALQHFHSVPSNTV